MEEVESYVKIKSFLKYNEAEDKYEELDLRCDLKELSHFGSGI